MTPAFRPNQLNGAVSNANASNSRIQHSRNEFEQPQERVDEKHGKFLKLRLFQTDNLKAHISLPLK